MKKIVLFILFLLISFFTFADYTVSSNCKEAEILLTDLKIDEAKQLLADELKINSDNYYALYLEQTCDAYRMLINGSENNYDTFIENYEAKRAIMDDKNISSPYYLLCKAKMDMQAGMFNIIYGSKLSGVNKMYKGYREIYSNIKKFPNFRENYLLDGFFNVALSNLPPFVKGVTSFFGVSSDFDYGFRLLDSLYQENKNNKGFNTETALFVIFAAKINKTPELVYNFTYTLDSNISNLFLFQYFKANIAFRTGRNDEALTVLKDMNADAHPDGKIIFDYLMGKALLRKLDNNAGYYLQQYLVNLKKQEYFKEMTYNLALFYLINNNYTKYEELCTEVKTKGIDINERDREALYDASLNYTPDINLVKSRLLLDGGYFDEAKHYLSLYQQNKRQELPYQLEFYFLTARYNFAVNLTQEAIKYFNRVIENGKDEDLYFASEAALQLGSIYEKSGEYEKAKKYYKLSLDLYHDDYYEYISDKAEKGLNRVKKPLK